MRVLLKQLLGEREGKGGGWKNSKKSKKLKEKLHLIKLYKNRVHMIKL